MLFIFILVLLLIAIWNSWACKPRMWSHRSAGAFVLPLQPQLGPNLPRIQPLPPLVPRLGQP